MNRKLQTAAALLLAGALVPLLAATPTKSTKATTHRTTGPSATHSKTTGKKKSRSRKLRGQQAIEPERVKQIQEALIKAHYLTGEADGEWDSFTVAAMQKFQADNNWQTKLMPDSRALIKLGLGPNYSDAINAKGSSFAPPATQPAAPLTSGFVDASGVKQ